MHNLPGARRLLSGFALLTLALSVTLAGCGSKSSPSGTVKGKVLLGDEPYADASVMFLSLESGQGGAADIQPDGTFSMGDSLPVGTYQVFLAPKASSTGSESGEATDVVRDPSVPEKYWSEATTDIKADIVEGVNDVVVPLKKK